MAISHVRIGTRGSALALRQTAIVTDLIARAYPDVTIETIVIRTEGDRQTETPLTAFGEVGVFTSALERALVAGAIDLAVHSAKDLPTQLQPGVIIGAFPARGNPADVLISRGGEPLDALRDGAAIGTSSRRRAAQLLRARPDLHIVDIRGNVDTRIAKGFAPDSPYDAIVLAYAGLERLDRLDVIAEVLPLSLMLPAPGQAAIAVECRDDEAWRAWLVSINDTMTDVAVSAERAFLAGLGGGCALPIAAYGVIEGDALSLTARVCAPDGTAAVELADDYSLGGAPHDAAVQAGEALAVRAIERGALSLLEAAP